MHRNLSLYIAEFISLVFHPVILFLFVPYFVVIHTTGSLFEAIKWMIISWIFIFSIVMVIYFQVKRGKFTNFDVSRREQRPLLFMYLAITLFLFILTLFFLHGPYSLIIMTLGIFIALLALDVINMRIKASVHVATVASILLSFVILNGLDYVWILFLVPFVGWSRIKLHRHTVVEVITGALFGLFLTLFLYAMIEYIR